MLRDPAVQATIVGFVANAMGATIALYLWTRQRRDRYLLDWALAWVVGTVRFLVHIPADSIPALRFVEGALLFPLIFFFNALACYDLLPTKPWERRNFAQLMAGGALAYGITANLVGRPIEMGYALAATVFFFDAACLAIAYRATRLSGHAFASITFLAWSFWFALGLSALGRDLSTTVISPLFNLPLALSLVVIAYQRRGKELAENQRTLQRIFDTAPTPLIIVRPPEFQVERANTAAVHVFGVPADGVGDLAVVDHAIAPDVSQRAALFHDLKSGESVRGREMVIQRVGGEERLISVNADLIALDGGDRVIYSFHDLTELRIAEEELRRSAEETRDLYVRLATVEDDERRALHAELHDQVGANLSALRLELDLAANLLSRGDAAGAAQKLDGARAVVGEVIAVARNLMAELRPPALDEFGLVAGLRDFAEVQAPRLGLAIQVAGMDLTPRPDRLVEGALFRIAHAAVMNAVRHASAKHVMIKVGERAGRVTVNITDDGTGFDPATPLAGSDHWGLKSMRERARAIGGTFHVESAPGVGTRVTAEAPREVT